MSTNLYRPIRVWTLASLLSGFWIPTAPAQEIDPPKALAWSAGAFLFRPRLEVAEQYDDKIFFQQTNAVSDFLTRVSPGLAVSIGTPATSYVGLAYTLDSWFYADNSELNHTDHSLTLRSNLKWSRSSLAGSDSFQSASGILGQNVTNRIEQQGVVTRASVSRFSYFDNYRYTQELTDKTSVYAEGNRTGMDFETDSGLIDYNTLRGSLGYEFKALPKTSFFGEAYYGQTATHPNSAGSPKGPHIEFFGTFVGARGDFTSRLVGTLKAGYEVRRYSDNSPAPDGPVVEASLRQQFSEKTTVALAYSRAHNVSFQAVAQSVTSDIVTATLAQRLGRRGKWLLFVGANFGRYEYDTRGFEARKDILIVGNLGLTYQVQKWLMSSLSYEFQGSRSNTSIDYDVNRVTLSVALGY